MQNNQLFIVGKVIDYKTSSWEFAGVFDSEELATKNCFGPEYFIGPAIINEAIQIPPEIWPKAYYPLSKSKLYV